MDKIELDKQINDAIMEMAKETQNEDGNHKLAELYMQQENYDKVMY